MLRLSDEPGITRKFATAKNMPTFEARLAAGDYGFAYMNPYHFTVFNESPGYKVIDDPIFDTSARISESDINYGRVELGIKPDSILASIKDNQRQSLIIAVVQMTLARRY